MRRISKGLADIKLLQLIKDRNAAASVSQWNTKMNAATTVMVKQLN